MIEKNFLKDFAFNCFALCTLFSRIVFLPKYKQKSSYYFNFHLTIRNRRIDSLYYPFAKDFKLLTYYRDSYDIHNQQSNKIFTDHVGNRFDPLAFYQFYGIAALSDLSSYLKNHEDTITPVGTDHFQFWKAFYRFQDAVRDTTKEVNSLALINKEVIKVSL